MGNRHVRFSKVKKGRSSRKQLSTILRPLATKTTIREVCSMRRNTDKISGTLEKTMGIS